ncbi:hypothetical protein C6A85_15445, partial [Mycobacterium sp. ITM-2017-0098]
MALENPTAPTGKETQFYTMLGTRGIWHKGWFAGAVHAASPAGEPSLVPDAAGSQHRVELRLLAGGRSRILQSHFETDAVQRL